MNDDVKLVICNSKTAGIDTGHVMIISKGKMYSYGPWLEYNFVRDSVGLMKIYEGDGNISWALDSYRQQGYGVSIYTLNLTDEQKENLDQGLNRGLIFDERRNNYSMYKYGDSDPRSTYELINDNCTTVPWREIITVAPAFKLNLQLPSDSTDDPNIAKTPWVAKEFLDNRPDLVGHYEYKEPPLKALMQVETSIRNGSELNTSLVSKRIAEQSTGLYAENSLVGQATTREQPSTLATQFPESPELTRDQARQDVASLIAEQMKLNAETNARVDALRVQPEQQRGLGRA